MDYASIKVGISNNSIVNGTHSHTTPHFGDMGGGNFSKMRYCLWGQKVVILQCDWKVENSRTKGANMADNGEQKDNHGRDVCIRKVVYVSAK